MVIQLQYNQSIDSIRFYYIWPVTMNNITSNNALQ